MTPRQPATTRSLALGIAALIALGLVSFGLSAWHRHNTSATALAKKVTLVSVDDTLVVPVQQSRHEKNLGGNSIDLIGRKNDYRSAVIVVLRDSIQAKTSSTDDNVCSDTFLCGMSIEVYKNHAAAQNRLAYVGTNYDAADRADRAHSFVVGSAFIRVSPNVSRGEVKLYERALRGQ